MDQQPHERRSDTEILPKPQICFESRFDVIKIIMSFALAAARCCSSAGHVVTDGRVKFDKVANIKGVLLCHILSKTIGKNCGSSFCLLTDVSNVQSKIWPTKFPNTYQTFFPIVLERI